MSGTASSSYKDHAHKPVVHVAVGVVQREDGRVLLAERSRGKLSEGCWELPGGKFELAETARQALARELHEELGVDLDAAFPWLTYEYAYPDKIVRLHYYRVLGWHGIAHGRERQRVSWEDPHAVSVSPLMPANRRALKALTLPLVYAISNAEKYGIAAFMRRLEAALVRGVRLIQVREPRMSPEQLIQFARRVTSLAHRYGASVLVNGSESQALKSGADGVHLTAQQLMQLKTPPAVGRWAASCHARSDIDRAVELQADFVVLSQVLPTASHPHLPGMGWQRFSEQVRDTSIPVFALGGMQEDTLETAMQHGAHGVCLLSSVW